MEQTSQFRTYDTVASVVFLKTKARFGGLSNMAPGFPLQVNGTCIRTSEALYQACRLPHRPDVQRRIIDERSPMTAKMRSKPYRHDSRRDWDQVRVNVMRWCLRVKLAQNWDIFSELLLDTGERSIVERSRKDDFWGAKPVDERTLVGMNVLGRLLMELREAVKSKPRENLLRVEPLPIKDFLLGGHPIKPVAVRTLKRAETVDGPRAQPRRRQKPESIGVQLPLTRAPKVAAYPSSEDTTEWTGDGGIGHLKPYPAYKPSGDECLGKVPEQWEVLRLKHWLRVNEVVLSEDTDPDYRFDYLDIGSVATGVLTAKPVPTRFESSPSRARRVVRSGDTIVSTVRTYLKAVWHAEGVRVNLIASTGFAVLTPRPGTFPKFVRYVCQSDVFTNRVTAESVGIAYPAIAETRLKTFDVAVPPLPEQAAIVRFLDYADRRIRRYIRAKQQLIKLLEDQKQALIHQAVTGQIDVRTGRPYPTYKTSGVEWLGKVPEHWEIRRIASFSPKITNGWVGPTRDILTESGVPYIQSLHIKQGQIQFIKKYFVSNDWLSGHDKAQLRHSDVIVVQTGDIGQVACVPPNFDGAGCHALIIIRTDPDVMSGRFLDLVLRSNYGYNSLLRMQTGALHPHLNCTWVREIFVPVPPLAEQVAIVRYLDKVTGETYSAIHCARRQIDLFREYRTRLIADVVTGKVDVREAADGLPEVDPLADECDAPIQAAETGVMELEDATESPEEFAMENEATV